MNRSERSPETPRATTGFFAMLANVFGASGTLASKIGYGSGASIAALMVALCGLMFSGAPALAAAPEAPETTAAKSVSPTEEVLEGVLNPKAVVAAKAGWYFAYSTEIVCAAGEVTPVQPEETVKAKTEKFTVKGLQPNKEYTFCIVATNEAGEATPSTKEVKFTTKPAVPTVEGETTSGVSDAGVTPAEARLEAGVNANNEEVTKCEFQYGTHPSLATSTSIPCEQATLEGIYGPQAADVNVTGLATRTTYYFRVLATNATGVSTGTAIESFTTPLHPATPETNPASEVTSSTATLNGVLNPTGAPSETATYEFVYRPSESNECTGEGEQSTASTATPGEKEAVSAKITELQPGVPYSFCLRAENKAGETATSTPETLTLAPRIETAESSNETPFTTELSAKINPDGSEVTSCVFEYGTTTAYVDTKPCEPPTIPPGSEAVVVSAHLEGLTPGSGYHWRLTATSSAGTTTSPDHTFALPNTATQTGDVNNPAGACPKTAEESPGFNSLPDCRVYEMVTPPQKNGAEFGAALITVKPAEVASDGQHVTTTAIQCVPGSVSCVPNRRPSEGDPYELNRAPDGGWTTRALAPSAAVLPTDSFYALNPEAETALFSAPGPPTGGDDFYGRDSEGTLTDIGPVGDREDISNEAISPGEIVATADLSHVLYRSIKGPPLWGFDETSEQAGGDLYEYSGAGNVAPLLVGVVGPEGSNQLVSHCGTTLPGANEAKFDGSVSEDGHIVYFGAEGQGCGPAAPAVEQLWARIDGEVDADQAKPGLPEAHSVQISAPAGTGCTSTPCLENTSKADEAERGRTPRFEAASSNGETAVFADPQQLTNAASESVHFEGKLREGEENLYESECPGLCADPASERHLIDVSDPGEGAAPIEGGPRVQGVMALSSDGSHVYFVAQGELTNEPNQDGEHAKAGEENLYVYAEGHLTFIATLAPSDLQSEQWAQGETAIANVTPNGQFFVFTDDRALTRDDTRPEGEAEHAAQVFEYDAATHQLTRVSIGQDGFNDNGNTGVGDAYIVNAEAGGDGSHTATLRRDPTMSENGQRVFFESPIALTPGALNSVQIGTIYPAIPVYAQNVYEWQAPDSSGCTEPAGCVYLISDGKDTTLVGYETKESADPAPTRLIGVDRTGANVFFSTLDQLSPQDTDTERDYYDAHVCSAAEPCTPPAKLAPPCGEGACQAGPTSAQGSGAPASQAFSGTGNLTPPPAIVPPKSKTAARVRAEKLAKALEACHKKKGKRRARCEKQARKAYGAKKSAKKATDDRKAK